MTERDEPCGAAAFPEPRDEYGYERDGGDAVPGVTRVYVVRAPVPYVAPSPEPAYGAPGEHAEGQPAR